MVLSKRTWCGLFAACGAIQSFAVAGSYCTGCTPEQEAKIEAKADADLVKLLGYENTVCLAANFLPGKARTEVILGCQIGEGLTNAAEQFLRVIESQRNAKATDGGKS